jgi:hypothetical protein
MMITRPDARSGGTRPTLDGIAAWQIRDWRKTRQ